ncbi:hypothetical protein AAFF_G00195560 [Aldrovandia affinis]|uniref:Uncharacterized protein n=1 Tax=Aldrovandia affinis TaxID=143900 RepID=A0AAD7RLK0_9TELE|nr:hypothetical protein AAFF_G00195560 [Aldrovandia affinis]
MACTPSRGQDCSSSRSPPPPTLHTNLQFNLSRPPDPPALERWARSRFPGYLSSWTTEALGVNMFCLASAQEAFNLLRHARICGFVSAVSPVEDDQENLMAFRFSALNPIVDPWIFIIFRKAVFRYLRSLFLCRFPRGALKSTAHSTLNYPPGNGEPIASTVLQAETNSNLPL